MDGPSTSRSSGGISSWQSSSASCGWVRRSSRPTGSWPRTAGRPRDGRFLEIVGTYAPRGASTAEPDAVIKIDNAKAVKWLVNGAQPTERVERLLKTSGAWDEFAAARAK